MKVGTFYQAVSANYVVECGQKKLYKASVPVLYWGEKTPTIEYEEMVIHAFYEAISPTHVKLATLRDIREPRWTYFRLDSFDQIRAELTKGTKLTFKWGEAFGCDVDWTEMRENHTIGVSDSDDYEDTHNRGRDVIHITFEGDNHVTSSYSSNEGNGIFARQRGHHDVCIVYTKELTLPLFVEVDDEDGEITIGGQIVTEEQLKTHLRMK